MRRPAALASAALAAALLLAGCSGDGDTGTEPPATGAPSGADAETLDAVEVEGEEDAPTLAFDTPFEIDAPVARVVAEGDGDALADGDWIAVDYLMVDGEGTELASTWETGEPERITIGDPQMVAQVSEVLEGQEVGVRVLVAIPGAEAAEGASVPATLMLLEVLEVLPQRAQGEAVEPPDGLPQVTLDDDGTPSIEIPAELEEPSELVVQPLVVGDGEEVETGDVVTFHYSGWLLDGTQFDSSWENGAPFVSPIGVGQVIQGWDQGLVGQTVGSQVLLVIPSELAYGPDGRGQIPPDATLVFVVDILGIN